MPSKKWNFRVKKVIINICLNLYDIFFNNNNKNKWIPRIVETVPNEEGINKFIGKIKLLSLKFCKYSKKYFGVRVNILIKEKELTWLRL